MLFLGKKKSETLDLSWLGTDMHSHLIPGIDDGADNAQTSLELIKGLQSFGYRKLITTPHIFWEFHPNTAEKIRAGYEVLQAAIKESGINIEVRAAAEYFMDEHLQADLRKKVPLLPISGNKVLVEFSMVSAPLDLQQILFDLQIQGYQPVIAHPERYVYLNHQRELFDELKDSGCWLQLNLLSLTGYYGRSVQELAEHLCKKDMYDLAGTDLHHERHLEALQKLTGSTMLARLRDSGILKNGDL